VVAPSALPGLDAKENSPAQVDERNTRVGHLQAGFWEFAAFVSCFNEIQTYITEIMGAVGIDGRDQ
jgi:hypothetical protein